MNFKQILPYKLRRALTIGAIAGGTLTACEKHANEPIIPTRDVDLEFNAYHVENIQENTIRKYAGMPDVRYVYLLTQGFGGWDTFSSDDISSTRDYLQQCININPSKVRGKGSFNFTPGVASKPDSLWYVQNGWAIRSR